MKVDSSKGAMITTIQPRGQVVVIGTGKDKIIIGITRVKGKSSVRVLAVVNKEIPVNRMEAKWSEDGDLEEVWQRESKEQKEDVSGNVPEDQNQK